MEGGLVRILTSPPPSPHGFRRAHGHIGDWQSHFPGEAVGRPKRHTAPGVQSQAKAQRRATPSPPPWGVGDKVAGNAEGPTSAGAKIAYLGFKKIMETGLRSR